MITKCSKHITEWLIRQEAVEKAEQEMYEYAVHSLILMLAPMMLAILFGSIMGLMAEDFVMILPFMVIRKFSGGYHAKHERNCLIGSSLLIMVCIYAAGTLEFGLVLSIVLGMATVSLMVFSPINHENRRLDAEERCSYKRMTVILTAIFLVLYVVLGWLGQDTFAVCIAVGLIFSAGLQVPCVVQKMMKIE